MELSGTVHLNEKSNNRYQFIYSSIQDNTVFGIYAKFLMKSNRIEAIHFRSINYNTNSRLGISNVILTPYHVITDTDNGSFNRRAISINCITLTITLNQLNPGEKPFEKLENVNIITQEDAYLRVLNSENVSKSISECEDSLMPTSESSFEKIAPGGICPRGYSKIIIS